MSARSLNKVILIGNLTRDPELRYTPNGTAVCTFGVATNRGWTTQTGEAKEETEFHRIVAWNKLGELCSQLLVKGRKVYVEGRLTTRNWTGQDGVQRTTVEVVIEDMIILDSKKTAEGIAVQAAPPPTEAVPPHGSADVEAIVKGPKSEGAKATSDAAQTHETSQQSKKTPKHASLTQKTKGEQSAVTGKEDISADDIPF